MSDPGEHAQEPRSLADRWLPFLSAQPVGLTQLHGSSTRIRCPSCAETTTTIACKDVTTSKFDARFEAILASALAVGTLGLALFFLGPTLQRALSNSTFHYCRRCGLRLAYWDATFDDTHIFIRDYLDWVASPDKQVAVKSPVGPPPDVAAISVLALGNPIRHYGHGDSCITIRPSSVRLTSGPMGPLPYNPKGVEPGGWRFDNPHMRVWVEEGRRLREVARVRVWGTKKTALIYLRNDDQDEPGQQQEPGWDSSAPAYALEPVGIWVDADSSMGQLFWTRRRIYGDSKRAPEEPEERVVLLDAYDRLLAMELPAPAGTSGSQPGPSLQVYRNLPDRLVEEIKVSWIVQRTQLGRISEYYWNEAVKSM